MNMLYADYAAATPLDSRVLTAMQPYFSDDFFNPSSSYVASRGVRTALEAARERVAHWLAVRPSEVIFTAGATESINLAIHGVMRAFPEGHCMVSAIEHPAVLNPAALYDHSIVPVDQKGTIELQDLKNQIQDTTVLLSVGYANNELGTIQPLREIAAIVDEVKNQRRKKGNTHPLYFHSDASQAAAYLSLQAHRLGVDLLTLNGGKIYGPKQSGILFVAAGVTLKPLVMGGGQELGLRSGTENVAHCIGFATALDIVQQDRQEAVQLQSALRDELQTRLQQALPQTVVNGNLKKRLPNTLHVSWPGIDGERLVMLLDEHGLQAATGSACAANKQTASHVLQAIGLPQDLLQGSLRLSFGAQTTPEMIPLIADKIITAVSQLISEQVP